ncbi:Sulfide:quinone oxidoreductase, mitochondrial [Smittium culicis]|uniref:Sulfide:quinone oxidoreductase, mitochondrial n=1 Tax=Smittium culicis TaxID=133412 RepID=A0A1R1X1P6_9FUNG|nr:Sulfide:quinone oxidoreductase, mitochondrial [Smittium culicis]
MLSSRILSKASAINRAASVVDSPVNPVISNSFKVLCIGAGTAGISLSATLSKKLGRNEVGIIEPGEYHYQQPLWTLVGAGLQPFEATRMKMSDIIPERATWLRQSAAKVIPDKNQVVLGNGDVVSYEYLVIASGLELDLNAISGLSSALGKDGVSTNYSPEYVTSTSKFLNEFKGGEAIFTMPATPVKCPGAPQKIAYLAEEKFRDNGIRSSTNVSYYTGIGKIFGIDKYADSMWKVANGRNINVNLMHDLISIDSAKKQASFKVLPTNEIVTKNYDFIHVTPKMKPHSYLLNSGSNLTNDAGYVQVDNSTLRHTHYKNIYGIGDSSSAPTSKTAAAACVQASVVKSNIYNLINNSLTKENEVLYNGYTSCPLITSKNSVVLAEFSGYTGKPIETFFFNQAKESKFSYWVTSNLIPKVYWNAVTSGSWDGPAPYRSLTNPLDSN